MNILFKLRCFIIETLSGCSLEEINDLKKIAIKLDVDNKRLREVHEVNLQKNCKLRETIVSLKNRIDFMSKKNLDLKHKVNELYRRNVNYASRINSQREVKSRLSLFAN